MTIPFEPRERSVIGIMADLLQQYRLLLQQEVHLAGAELSEKLNRAVIGAVMAVVAAVLFIPALVILLLAAVLALETTGLAPYWSALIIGGAALLMAALLLLIGIGRLKAKYLVPRKTIHQLQKDAALAKHQVEPQENSNGLERAA